MNDVPGRACRKYLRGRGISVGSQREVERFLAIIFLLVGDLAWVAVGVLLYSRRKALGKTEVMRRVETSVATELTGMALGSPSRSQATCATRVRLRARWPGRSAPAISRR